MKATKTSMGVRYQIGMTGLSRFSTGKTHVLFWSPTYKAWVLVCRPNDRSGVTPYQLSYPDEIVFGDNLCKTCATTINRVFG
jgi:hypothetical protein